MRDSLGILLSDFLHSSSCRELQGAGWYCASLKYWVLGLGPRAFEFVTLLVLCSGRSPLAEVSGRLWVSSLGFGV